MSYDFTQIEYTQLIVTQFKLIMLIFFKNKSWTDCDYNKSMLQLIKLNVKLQFFN
jgi:hypothetical protein